MQYASDVGVSSRPRIVSPDRSLADPFPKTIDELIPARHRARDVWEMTLQLNCQGLLEEIESVEGHPGRPRIDPRILVALWLYANIDGISSARKLAALVKEHNGYKWIAGGVEVCYHTLATFRTNHNDWLIEQIVAIVANLQDDGLIDLKQVAQDGMRVRASAGSSTFKRRGKLDELLKQAEKQLADLEQQLEHVAYSGNKRQQSAQRRAARERVERLRQAKRQRDEVAQSREKRKKGDGQTARASTTDPQARRMKMADGGYRPAMNVQYATLVGSLLIAGVMVVNAGSDGGQMTPMIDQLETNYGVLPEEYFADGGYATIEDIETTEQRGITTYLPVKQSRSHPDRYAPRKDDSDITKRWRKRMSSSEGQQKYACRGLCEWSNAEGRRHGMDRLLVRGLEKAKSIALWHALTQNLTRARSLRAQKS